MSRVVRHNLPILGVLLALAGPPARADDPDAVLKAAGLRRVDNSFVLDGELDARKLETQMQDVEKKLNQAMQEKQQAQLRIAQDQEQAAGLRAQANQLRAQSRGMGGRGRGNAFAQQARDLDNRAQRLLQNDARNSPAAKQNADADKKIAAGQKELQPLQARYKTLVDQARKRYDELARQTDVVEALRTLNKGAHPKAALGPIPAYQANLIRQCTEHLQDLGLRHDQNLFYVDGEDDLVKRAAAAALKHREATKAGDRKGDPAARGELATLAQELRARVAELETKRATLIVDAEVSDLMAEIQKGTKKKVRLGSLTSYQRAMKEVEALEQATAGQPAGARP